MNMTHELLWQVETDAPAELFAGTLGMRMPPRSGTTGRLTATHREPGLGHLYDTYVPPDTHSRYDAYQLAGALTALGYHAFPVVTS